MLLARCASESFFGMIDKSVESTPLNVRGLYSRGSDDLSYHFLVFVLLYACCCVEAPQAGLQVDRLTELLIIGNLLADRPHIESRPDSNRKSKRA